MGNGQSCGYSNGRSVRHGHQTRTSKRSSVSRANGRIGQSGGQSRGHDQARTNGQSSTDRSSGQHQRTGKRLSVSRANGCGYSNGRSVRRPSKRSSGSWANGQIGQPDGQSRGHDQARTTRQSSTNRANGQINQRPTEQSNGRRLLNHRMGYRYVSFRDSSSNIQVSLRLQV